MSVLAQEREQVVGNAIREISHIATLPEVTVKVVEPVPGDWEMVSESQKHTKGDAQSAVWQVMVPAGGKATLAYTVRMRW